jgi:hypothetical protein
MTTGLDCAIIPFWELGRETIGVIEVGLHGGRMGNGHGGGKKETVDILFITACTAVWKITF